MSTDRFPKWPPRTTADAKALDDHCARLLDLDVAGPPGVAALAAETERLHDARQGVRGGIVANHVLAPLDSGCSVFRAKAYALGIDFGTEEPTAPIVVEIRGGHIRRVERSPRAVVVHPTPDVDEDVERLAAHIRGDDP